MNASLDRLGSFLRTSRESQGLTQEQLSKRLKVTKGYISRLERDKAKPAIAMLQSIAEELSLNPNHLLMLAGHLPKDLGEILRSYPVAAATVLRESFGEDLIQSNDKPLASRFTAGESKADYRPTNGTYDLVEGDCISWLEQRNSNSIQAIVTDPPYGLKEYTDSEKTKLRKGKGGVWRVPPSLDGYARSPLPRFTILSEEEKRELREFFLRWATEAFRVLVPGGHIFIATNPLLSHLVYLPLLDAGFEKRGEVIRLVQTLRGGDRPKNAHEEFGDVSVMARSCWEPWGLFRKPCEGRVQDNLRKWKTGGLRRISDDQPFCDVIRSAPTRSAERQICPHPSLKPQAFMRQIVRAALPLGQGTILDPFMGGGSTIAAAVAVGYNSIGIERDPEYFTLAKAAIQPLSEIMATNEMGLQVATQNSAKAKVQQGMFT